MTGFVGRLRRRLLGSTEPEGAEGDAPHDPTRPGAPRIRDGVPIAHDGPPGFPGPPPVPGDDADAGGAP